MRWSLLLLVACSSIETSPEAVGGEPPAVHEEAPPSPSTPEAGTPDADDDSPWSAHVERCGNGIDDDGDGLVDEVCEPSLFIGMFAPGGGFDTSGHAAKLSTDLGHRVSVVQTYRATSSFDTAKVPSELAAIWASGSTPHLYLEPAGYTSAQIKSGAADADLAQSATAIADTLVAHPEGRLFVSFGAEMNGTWTTWGCVGLTPAQFIAFERQMHDALDAALAARAIDPRRVRWVYAPNATSDASCSAPSAYYPGHAYVDYLGVSAYRHESESVAIAVTNPTTQMMDDLAYPPSWRRNRFMILQTGSRTAPGDRGAWLTALVTQLASASDYAGIIPFDTSDDASRDWAILSDSPPTPREGYAEFVDAAKALPPIDAKLEQLFEPYFWDVHPDHARYPEIQALRAAKITNGCSAAPPLFCPDDALSHDAALAFLGTAGITTIPDPVTRADFAAALATYGKAKPADLQRLALEAEGDAQRPITRGEAAAWLVHITRIAPAPRLP